MTRKEPLLAGLSRYFYDFLAAAPPVRTSHRSRGGGQEHSWRILADRGMPHVRELIHELGRPRPARDGGLAAALAG